VTTPILHGNHAVHLLSSPNNSEKGNHSYHYSVIRDLQDLNFMQKEYSYEGGTRNNNPPADNTNKFPIANAGPDQVITLPTDSVSLDGTSSSDPDRAYFSQLLKFL